MKNTEETVLPLDRILVIDINYLANKKQTKKAMEKEYGCKVLLIDGSRQNTQGLEKITHLLILYKNETKSRNNTITRKSFRDCS